MSAEQNAVEGLSEGEVELHVCCLKPRLCTDEHFHQRDVERIVAARVRLAVDEFAAEVERRIEAMAAELDWVKPEVSPCAPNFETCCGSEAACDAMCPVTKVVGAAWIRERSARIVRDLREQGGAR